MHFYNVDLDILVNLDHFSRYDIEGGEDYWHIYAYYAAPVSETFGKDLRKYEIIYEGDKEACQNFLKWLAKKLEAIEPFS